MSSVADVITGSETVVRAACPHDCPDTCAMLITVREEQGRRVAVKVAGDPTHPTTAGTLCTKVSRYLERTYHPDRVLHPLKRVGAKGDRRFVRVSWDEALRDIAQRLGEVAARDPQASCPTAMPARWVWCRASRWLRASSQARRVLSRSHDLRHRRRGAGYDDRRRIGIDIEEFQNARLIVFWG